MKRRSFLQLLGFSAAVPVIAKAAEKIPEITETQVVKEVLDEEAIDVWTPYFEKTEWGTMSSYAPSPVIFRDIKNSLK